MRERNKKVRAEGWGDEELVEAFVAIDDRALLQERGGDRLHGHFVMTHPYVPPLLFSWRMHSWPISQRVSRGRE